MPQEPFRTLDRAIQEGHELRVRYSEARVGEKQVLIARPGKLALAVGHAHDMHNAFAMAAAHFETGKQPTKPPQLHRELETAEKNAEAWCTGSRTLLATRNAAGVVELTAFTGTRNDTGRQFHAASFREALEKLAEHPQLHTP